MVGTLLSGQRDELVNDGVKPALWVVGAAREDGTREADTIAIALTD